MDRLEAMSIVLEVAEAGSLAGAARRLNTPVATASRKISELEAHLRTKLFDRTARNLALTAAGASYIASSKRILADVMEAERAAAGEYSAPTGELIVTGPNNLGRQALIPILAEFLRIYPKIDVHLVLTDRLELPAPGGSSGLTKSNRSGCAGRKDVAEMLSGPPSEPTAAASGFPTTARRRRTSVSQLLA